MGPQVEGTGAQGGGVSVPPEENCQDSRSGEKPETVGFLRCGPSSGEDPDPPFKEIPEHPCEEGVDEHRQKDPSGEEDEKGPLFREGGAEDPPERKDESPENPEKREGAFYRGESPPQMPEHVEIHPQIDEEHRGEKDGEGAHQRIAPSSLWLYQQ